MNVKLLAVKLFGRRQQNTGAKNELKKVTKGKLAILSVSFEKTLGTLFPMTKTSETVRKLSFE